MVALTWQRPSSLSVTDHTPSVASGTAVQDLLGSLAGTVTADGTDLLGTREEAVPWLRPAGLLPDDAVISGSEHGALLRLRDALRDVLAVRASGAADPDATARLTRALADGRLVVTVTPAGAAGAGQFRAGQLLQPRRRHRDRGRRRPGSRRPRCRAQPARGTGMPSCPFSLYSRGSHERAPTT